MTNMVAIFTQTIEGKNINFQPMKKRIGLTLGAIQTIEIKSSITIKEK